MIDYSLIIDTDAGGDDMMAIAYLLSRNDVNIEAITVVYGLAHVEHGANNIRKLLQHSGKPNINVYEGAKRPISGSRFFPPSWCANHIFDEIFGSVDINILPENPSLNAIEYLNNRFQQYDVSPFRLLALGPLTNIALSLKDVKNRSLMQDIIIMGGAIMVPGNITFDDPNHINKLAEWNIYCDPEAANEVFSRSDFKHLLISLDITNKVPITKDIYDKFHLSYHNKTLTQLGEFVYFSLKLNEEYILNGSYYAWDNLAAICAVDSEIIQHRGARIIVHNSTDNCYKVGFTELIEWNEHSDFRVGVDVDSANFYSKYFDVFFEQ